MCDNGSELSWTGTHGWISLIQSTDMSSTGISSFQQALLLDIVLTFFRFANHHPDLRPQELYLLSGALVEATVELGPRERADTHLYQIACMARRELPPVSTSVYYATDLPAELSAECL